MTYVRSRKFCCCLPVRFGVFCMALLGFLAAGALGAIGWSQVHRLSTKDLALDGHQTASLWLLSLSETAMFLISIVGLIGVIGKMRGMVTMYAYSVTTNTIINIAVGIFFVWSLFHRDQTAQANAIDHCVGSTTGEVGKVKSWLCDKGFDAIRIVLVVVFVIIWIFMLAGIFIVFDYVGQLREEDDQEDTRALKKAYSQA